MIASPWPYLTSSWVVGVKWNQFLDFYVFTVLFICFWQSINYNFKINQGDFCTIHEKNESHSILPLILYIKKDYNEQSLDFQSIYFSPCLNQNTSLGAISCPLFTWPFSEKGAFTDSFPRSPVLKWTIKIHQ